MATFTTVDGDTYDVTVHRSLRGLRRFIESELGDVNSETWKSISDTLKNPGDTYRFYAPLQPNDFSYLVKRHD